MAERLAALGVHDAGDIELDPPSGKRGPSGLLNERALVRLVKTTRDAVERRKPWLKPSFDSA